MNRFWHLILEEIVFLDPLQIKLHFSFFYVETKGKKSYILETEEIARLELIQNSI